ncbi:thiol-disulfide oxidoreductase DCC family protein [Algoriphagus zhangzhouensis]|uniref:Predicted thiol-disulfide oxidoreductase YuxK, DCC family n=1 Tax=Algoriphagus zhangzhouensis TaxID=1073327 RepID=A0A1M7ZEX5_9BACT|nr:thiol-disulfide oxidoreductase DCC family protein [Algoriphagus zhangzhouensis]TDY46133.1 putative DCC family thiol-disulfide oxidoreductase YuxK [Algoriphagus zhangzhouensis]SHO63418.1 Predicted thiol-disulfide oxidoreductase YuxK, DCC family [Algoriphagus zhangzhouensis]
MSQPKSIVFFDGVCNLCNSSVDFMIKRDKNDRFLVGALQDETSKEILSQFDVKEDYLDSIVLLENGKIFYKSTAALKIAKQLSGFWPALYPLVFFPQSLRDAVYDWIGKNRYKWFGKQNTCRLPSPEEQAKFLSPSNSPFKEIA